jgi:hypothetical protein
MRGRSRSARATRTFSRAMAGANPTRQLSQCATDLRPCPTHASCSSASRIKPQEAMLPGVEVCGQRGELARDSIGA